MPSIHTVLIGNPFFLSTLIVSLLIYLRADRPRMHRGITLAAGLVLAVVFDGPASACLQVMLVLGYWALSAFLLELILPFFQKQHVRDLSLIPRMAFPPAASFVTVLFLCRMIPFTPITLDMYYYRFDGSLGWQPSFWTAQLLLRNDWLRIPSEAVYMNLPVGLALVYFWQQSRSRELAGRTLTLFLTVATAGYLCYFLTPAVGPGSIFAKVFPFHPPALASLRIEPVAVSAVTPRNCMPSLHTAWALSLLWSTRGMSWWRRYAAGAFFTLTLLYAGAAGGHYIVDLIVAVPFTLAVYAATRGTAAWRVRTCQVAFAGGVLLFAAWLIVLRWGGGLFLVSRTIPWLAILFSCAVSLTMRNAVDGAVEQLSLMPDGAADPAPGLVLARDYLAG